jgi:hypothetical protein
MNITPVNFEDYDIRRVYDEKTETWYFSVVDIIRALLQQPDFQAVRNYWKVLKNRLSKEGSESVTKCNRLKLEAADGKKYLTDVTSPEVLLRLIQSVPSPKAKGKASKSINQANINATIMRNIKVPVPSLAEQKRLVAKAEKLEKQMAEAQAVIAAAPARKQAIMQRHL